MWKNLLTPDKALAPYVLQIFAVALILISVVALIFGQAWGAALLGTGGSMLGIGEYAAAAATMKDLQKHLDQSVGVHPPPQQPQKVAGNGEKR